MNILRVIASTDPRTGGPIEGVFRSSAAMAALGHTNEIVSLDQPSDPWVATSPLKVHAIGHVTRRFGYAPKLASWLAANAGRYDGVIVHGVWNYGSLGAHRALAGRHPYLLFPHGMLDPWFLQESRLKGTLKRLYWRLLQKRVLDDASYVMFTTEEERRLAQVAYGPPKYRERVVAYGTADAPPHSPAMDAAFRERLPALGRRPYLLFLSRIHPKKGCDLLLKAFAETRAAFPDLDLVIAGPDQIGWTRTLQELAAKLGVSDRIHWPGMLSGDAKWGAYYGAQAFVLPSHQENFGIVVAEAMACGRPVLITDKVNIWRDVEAFEAGLVASDDITGVRALLTGFAALSKDEQAAMGQRARKGFLQRFEINAAARDILAAVEEVKRP